MTSSVRMLPIKLLLVLFATGVAFAMIFAVSGSSSGQSASVTPQSSEHVFDVGVLAVADTESGTIQTFDSSGNPTNPFAEQGLIEGDAVAYGFAGGRPRTENDGCVIVARPAVNVLDICINHGAVTRVLDFEFSPDDALAFGPVLGPEGSSDEIVIGRASTGEIEIWDFNFPTDPTEPLILRATIDADYSAADSVFITEQFLRDTALYGFGSEIITINQQTRRVQIFNQSPDDPLEFDHIGPSTELPYSFTDAAVGTLDSLDRPIIATAADNGVIAIFDYSHGRFPRIMEITTLQTGYGPGSSMVMTDLHANTYDSIVISNAETGQLEVYNYTLDRANPFNLASPFPVTVSNGAQLAAFDIALADIDGDGLKDIWETHGLDATGDGNIDVDLPAMGADPMHKDLFIELDYAVGRQPNREALQMVVDAFAAAPIDAGGVENPSGLPGINLRFDTGGLTEGGLPVGVDLGNEQNVIPTSFPRICGLGDEFYQARDEFFDPARSLVFRYAISGESGCGTGGVGEVPGRNFIVHHLTGDALSRFPSPPTEAQVEIAVATEAGIFMHELGHNLGLEHGGFQRLNCKPNYVSVMNYDHPFLQQTNGDILVDFSPARHPDGRGSAPLPQLREHQLSEFEPLDPHDPYNQFVFTSPPPPDAPHSDLVKVLSPVNAEWIDWNGDQQETPDSELEPQNINTIGRNDDGELYPEDCENDTTDATMEGHHDWDSISLPMLRPGTRVHIEGSTPTTDELIALLQALNTADLEISLLSTQPIEGIAGEEIDIELSISNNGPNPSAATHVTADLPDNVSFASSSHDCEASADGISCDIGYLLSGAIEHITVTLQLDAAMVYNAGGPTSVALDFEALDTGVGIDPDPSNNSTEVTVDVTGESDLEILTFDGPVGIVDGLIGQSTNIRLDLDVTNYGPSGPTDATLSLDTANDLPIDIELNSTESISAIDVDEVRTLEPVISVTCTDHGVYDVTVTLEIDVDTNGVTDPVESNNETSADITVHCIVPVVINIMPGGDPNPINLRSGGVTPVAVLTTEAGEYDLPLDFDATAIDPTTVIFGRAENLLGTTDPTGASVFQNRGHIEDVYELDQVTKDGDLDMLLRFRTQETGLTQTDTQACLRGQTEVDETGERVTFFGCGDIVIRP